MREEQDKDKNSYMKLNKIMILVRYYIFVYFRLNMSR